LRCEHNERIAELERALLSLRESVALLVDPDRLSAVPTFWWNDPPNAATADVIACLKLVRRAYIVSTPIAISILREKRKGES
jgi:hypothetical protein